MLDFDGYIKALGKLVECKSVKGKAEKDAPFGKDVKAALDEFLSIAKSFGFDTVNYDGYAGEVIFGEGEEVGIIGHLDVVPAGEGWSTPPFTLTKIGDTYFGRGVSDDKGPLLSALFALKALKDKARNGGVSNKKFRLIAGCDEESGWEDYKYLKSKTTLPEYGFSPDGDFPVSYAEKGMAIVNFYLPVFKNFYSPVGGTVVNAVCAKASVFLRKGFTADKSLIKKYGLISEKGEEGEVITSLGKSAHGSRPEEGINALKALFAFLEESGENVKNVNDYLFSDMAGISEMENEQGKVTFSPDVIKESGGRIIITVDLRFPAPFTFDDVKEKLDRFGIEYDYSVKHPPLHVPKEGKFVGILTDAYCSVTGERAQPISMGGSTFARVFKKGVSFGPEFEGVSGHIHEADERVSEENILKTYNIYEKAIFALAENKKL